MTNKELQATRKLLMLDASEAAEEIGGVSVRSWQYWETGERPVPDDVAEEMRGLLDLRLQMMAGVDDRLATGEEPLRLEFYSSFAEYTAAHPGARKVEWRLSQSVAALYFTEGHADLI